MSSMQHTKKNTPPKKLDCPNFVVFDLNGVSPYLRREHTQSVCVCTIHQKTKLLVDVFSGNINGCMRRINRAAAGDADGEEVEEVQGYLQGLNEDYCV